MTDRTPSEQDWRMEACGHCMADLAMYNPDLWAEMERLRAVEQQVRDWAGNDTPDLTRTAAWDRGYLAAMRHVREILDGR